MKFSQAAICLFVVALCATVFIAAPHGARAQVPCTAGNMVISGASGNSECGGVPTAPASIGTPNIRTLVTATAYQASDPTHPAIVTINLTSTANISLSGGTTNVATVLLGATNAVAGGTGTIICSYGNSNTGTLTLGLNLSTIAAIPCTFMLPLGYYFAVRTTTGTVTIGSAFDQGVN